MPLPFSTVPAPGGLYNPGAERDACGVAFVAEVQGRGSHRIVEHALTALHNLDHRGAAGADPRDGDGAGITVAVPDEFLRAVVDFDLPPAGHYAAGVAFMPRSAAGAALAVAIFERAAAKEGLRVLGWRELPTNSSMVGPTTRSVMPTFRQVFVAGHEGESGIELDRKAFCLRKASENRAREQNVELYLPSLSARTIVYKGMLTTDQLGEFFPDLRDERFASPIGLVHSRFSTNTFPSWSLAHPFRYVAHNGEINTIRGNRNWMQTREALLASNLIPGDLSRLFPICTPGASDSASFDEVLELLHMGGRSLPHAVLMMIPEAWENDQTMERERRDFYRFHASFMEPWDGPACVAFTDGSIIGAVLDRNGLRPGRWWRTKDDLVVLASEAGVLEIDPTEVVARGRLSPGRMFLVDTVAGELRGDVEVKAALAAAAPYGSWLREELLRLDDLPAREHVYYPPDSVSRRQQIFGYTEEELRILLTPTALTGAEAIGSMGTDTPLAALSQRPRLLFDYFSQLFAQVTNPPLDAIREQMVTSYAGTIGAEQNLFEASARSCRQLVLPRPVVDNDELAKIWHINANGDRPDFQCHLIDGRYKVHGGEQALAAALDRVQAQASEAIRSGARILILSDRDTDEEHAPIPSLLMTAAVHRHLVRTGQRTEAGLIVETGEAREVHHVALLIGYGASAVNPYLAFETIDDLIARGRIAGIANVKAISNYVTGLSKGVLKVMSKMGISTLASYTGAQVFEAFGLSAEVMADYFAGTRSPVGGIGLEVIAQEAAMRHARAYPKEPSARAHRQLEVGGEYQWRREGELHLFNPQTVFLLQHATRGRSFELFQEYTDQVEKLNREGGTIRGLLEFTHTQEPVPIDEVESVESILTRFATGAMSYGSISAEAHETLAIAMNRIGGKSNSGEGGEDAQRFTADTNGDLRRSAVKQVASGRFGVTSHYLVNADDIQIKLAQGAKPGEGGQLPGYKVYPWVARTRNSTPGVGLISPPPHHDIYSIEDLAQLIHDLKNANPAARIHAKLVAEAGVGTVAAGVSKAHADVVLISGHDGGTGAAPMTSLKHAGVPWEIGLAETQQTLMINGLRDRITVQVDGAMKTGRDVIIAALLGAEEFGFATAPLIVSGCVMMRVCHLDTCPVGVATQNPLLRARFSGQPEFVVTFFEFIAQQVRQFLAELGLRTIEEAIGRVDLLQPAQHADLWKARGLDLSPILAAPVARYGDQPRRVRAQDHGLEHALDNTVIALCEGALLDGEPVQLEMPVRNVNRSVGTMLGSLVTSRYGAAGLPEGTIEVTFNGTAGQSFGAFLPAGITLRLQGDGNDYVGKGLSGGIIVLRPHPDAPLVAEQNIIAGNVIGYGATSGAVYLRGIVGERFAVRNSGATLVCEGVGNHALEYMTGGTVVILGATGRNVAAGMSGGQAYVLDLDPALVNPELVEVAAPASEELEALKSIIAKHLAFTDSAVARELLANWPAASARFSSVVARDYRRIMDASAKALAAGADVDAAVMAAAKG